MLFIPNPSVLPLFLLQVSSAEWAEVWQCSVSRSSPFWVVTCDISFGYWNVNSGEMSVQVNRRVEWVEMFPLRMCHQLQPGADHVESWFESLDWKPIRFSRKGRLALNSGPLRTFNCLLILVWRHCACEAAVDKEPPTTAIQMKSLFYFWSESKSACTCCWSQNNVFFVHQLCVEGEWGWQPRTFWSQILSPTADRQQRKKLGVKRAWKKSAPVL